MKKPSLLLLLAPLFFLAPHLRALEAPKGAEYKADSGPFSVEIVHYDWSDTNRDRKVPAKIYYPKGAGPFPVIIFSHGLGGSREGYEYLGRHWASHGYVSVHLQHIGSDDSIWRDASPGERMQRLRQAVANLENAANRPQDVSFAIDRLEKLNHEDRVLKGHLDLKHLGVGGHSFGAFTALAIAGQRFGGQQGNISWADPRVKAVIPMSAPVTPIQGRLESAYDAIKIPCFHMTGTEDSSPIGETRPQDRRIPFDRCHNSDQFLVTFNGGDHMIFSGRGRMAAGEKDVLFQRYIRMSSTAFWDAYLKQDKKAKEWLTGTGFEKTLGAEGKLEKKLENRK
jgi:dienelactone hydrolase